MVTAKEICERYSIPRGTLYRLIGERRIPAQNVTQPWHKRKQYRFCLHDVEQALSAHQPPAS